MATIDDKVHALEFDVETLKSPTEVKQILETAAAAARPGKVDLLNRHDGGVEGYARSQLRIKHATFQVDLQETAGGNTNVTFRIPDYLRSRDTLLYIIPVGPWAAPAYSTLSKFSNAVQEAL